MARTKQAQIELPEEAENVAPAVVAQTEPASIPTKRVKNFLRQEWEEEVPATPPATQQGPDPGNVVAIVEEESDVYDFPETPFEGLLRKMGNSSDRYSVTVWELPNYGKDGNASPSARRKLCGTIPIPSSLEDLEEFCTLIQEQFALSGKDLYYFLPIVRKNNRIEQCDLGVLEIRGLAGEKTVPAEPRPETLAAPVAATNDPLSELQRSLKVFKQIQEIMAPAKHELINVPVVPQAEITTEAALLKLISENPEAVERIAERFLPTTGRGHGGDPWLEFLKPLVPALAPVLASLATKLLIPAQPVAEVPNSAETVDALPAEQPTASFPLEEKYGQAIGQILFGIENGLAPDYVGEGLDMLLEKRPDLGPILQNFLAVPPAQVIQHLASLSPQAAAVCRLTTAEKWLTDLQGYFAGEDEVEQK